MKEPPRRLYNHIFGGLREKHPLLIDKKRNQITGF